MVLKIYNRIFIDENYIIQNYNLNSCSTNQEIIFAIESYINQLDDIEYYNINSQHRTKIFNRIKNIIGEQIKLEL